MEKAVAPHSSTLAWKVPWTEKPGRLQSMGSLRVGHDWATSLLLFTFMHWRRKWQPTPVFLSGESQGRGNLVGCRLWGRKSRTRLKRLSSSIISEILYSYMVMYYIILFPKLICHFKPHLYVCPVISVVSNSLWPFDRSHILLQGIFSTQGSDPCLLCLLHFWCILYSWASGEVQTMFMKC